MDDQARMEIVITAADRATAVLKSLGGTVDGLANKVKNLQQSFRPGADGANGLQALGRAFTALANIAGRVLMGMVRGFTSLVQAAVRAASQILSAFVGAFREVAAAAVRTGVLIGGALGVAFAATAKAGIDMNLAITGATRALTRISGSAPQASRLIGDVRREAQISTLTFRDMLPLAQSVGAVYVQAFGPAGLGKVIPTMRAFQDTAATLNAGPEDVKLALRGFRQLAGGRFAQLDELRQIEDALPGSGISAILKEKFGTADTEALKAANVTGMQVAEAIVAGFNAKFGGSQMEAAGTLPVLLSNFVDGFRELAGSLSGGLLQSLTGAVQSLLGVFQGLAQNEKVVTALRVPFDLLAKALDWVSENAETFGKWLEQILTKENVVNFIAQLVGWFQALAQAVAAFVNTATGGRGLVGLWDAFQQAALTAINFVWKAWNGLAAAIGVIAQNGPAVWDLMRRGADAFVGVLETAVGLATVLVALITGQKVIGVLTGLGQFAGGLGAFGAGGSGGAGGAAGGGAGSGLGAMLLRLMGPGLAGIGIQNLMNGDPLGLGWSGGPKGVRTAGMGFGGGGGSQGGGGGAPGDFWGNPIGNQLKNLGHMVLGGASGLAQSGIADLAQKLGTLPGQVIQAAVAAAQGADISQFFGAQQTNAANAKTFINGLLAPRQGAAGSGLPPAHDMGQSFARQGGAAAGGMSADDIKDMQAARSAFWEAQLSAVQTFVRGLPEEQRAVAEAERSIPILTAQAQDLAAKIAAINPASSWENAEKYWKGVRQFWGIQGEITELNTRGSQAQSTAAKKAADEQQQVIEGRVGLIEAFMKANPAEALAIQQQRLVPALQEKIRTLGQAVPGETESERLKRMTEMVQTQGEVSRLSGASGVDAKGRPLIPPGYGATLGGGLIPLMSQAKGGDFATLDRMLGAAGGSAIPNSNRLTMMANETTADFIARRDAGINYGIPGGTVSSDTSFSPRIPPASAGGPKTVVIGPFAVTLQDMNGDGLIELIRKVWRQDVANAFPEPTRRQ